MEELSSSDAILDLERTRFRRLLVRILAAIAAFDELDNLLKLFISSNPSVMITLLGLGSSVGSTPSIASLGPTETNRSSSSPSSPCACVLISLGKSRRLLAGMGSLSAASTDMAACWRSFRFYDS
jgi:hypothetical protein